METDTHVFFHHCIVPSFLALFQVSCEQLTACLLSTPPQIVERCLSSGPITALLSAGLHFKAMTVDKTAVSLM